MASTDFDGNTQGSHTEEQKGGSGGGNAGGGGGGVGWRGR